MNMPVITNRRQRRAFQRYATANHYTDHAATLTLEGFAAGLPLHTLSRRAAIAHEWAARRNSLRARLQWLNAKALQRRTERANRIATGWETVEA